MICPFVFVHPPKQHEKQFDKYLFLYWEKLYVALKVADYLIRYVNDVSRFGGLPVIIVISFLYEKLYVVGKAYEYFFLFSFENLKTFQKIADHILAALFPIARLELLIVIYSFARQDLLELLMAVVVGDRVIFIGILVSFVGYHSRQSRPSPRFFGLGFY